MQTKKNDSCIPFWDSGDEQDYSHFQRGVTKREYFAAMALQGILASGSDFGNIAASLAVQSADDLILMLNEKSSLEENEL